MWEYYALLWLRRGLPVLPIALYLAPGTGGLAVETFETVLFGDPILTFRYRAVGLPDLAEADDENQPNPLGPALGTFMRSPETRRVVRRLRALQKRAIIEADDARRALLLGLIDRALPLTSEQETDEFRRLLGEPAQQEVRNMITIYEQWGLERGLGSA